MRIGRWAAGGRIGEGFVDDDVVLEFPDGGTVRDVLAAGLAALPALRERADRGTATPLDAVRLLAPLVPASIRDFVAFEEHVEGVSAAVDGRGEVVPEWHGAPTFYFTNPHTVLGPGDAVRPPATERLDFELEVAAVLGGPDGRDLDAAGGAAAIFGYTVLNDWSARDLQSREMRVRLGPAKGKDFASSLGPVIVTADELAPLVDADGFLAVEARASVNGELVGHDLVSNMGWPFGELVAYASRDSRVVAGDVLGSGTVGNGGCLAELWGRRGRLDPPPLATGDEVRLEVEGIGALVNRVGERSAATGFPAARPRSRARVRPAS